MTKIILVLMTMSGCAAYREYARLEAHKCAVSCDETYRLSDNEEISGTVKCQNYNCSACTCVVPKPPTHPWVGDFPVRAKRK